MDKKEIIVTGAKVHNLKNISVSIPKNKITVITGPSGSGKSSLAYDTIFTEGQRRYIESLSSYARQFLGQLEAPDVESIEGLSPAVSIEQHRNTKNPRSTVGTNTEIYNYLRVLFSKVGQLYCPESGKLIKKMTPTKILKELSSHENGTKITLISPIKIPKDADIKNIITKYLSMGFLRALVDNESMNLEEIEINDNFCFQYLDVVVDRIIIKENISKRLFDSIEQALIIGNGTLVSFINGAKNYYSEKNISPITLIEYPDLEPKVFSFNSPFGACQTCKGIGKTRSFQKELMITDPTLTINEGGIKPLNKKTSFLFKLVESTCFKEKIDLDTPINKLPNNQVNIIFNGSNIEHHFKFKTEKTSFNFKKCFPGIINYLEMKISETSSDKIKKDLMAYQESTICNTCNGSRLGSVALNTKITEKNIFDLCQMSIESLQSFMNNLTLTSENEEISQKIRYQITRRLEFLSRVGLNYLSLNREASTLSGGESQRIRLATQIGASLSGVLYVLDEPSIGLHPKDNDGLLKTLTVLKEQDNTVIVIEHDKDTILHSDYLIDMGKGAGIHGGEIISKGTIDEITKDPKSLTGQYLSKTKEVSINSTRNVSNKLITLKGACLNNLKNIDVDFPLGNLICITGVSGSGKSTLIHQILAPAIKSNIKRKPSLSNAGYQSITGIDKIKTIIQIDQSPIGKTPLSNPATYTNIFDEIRKVFANVKDAKIRGYKQGRFSFNTVGGRCEECSGNGKKKIEMHFLPDVFITCDECNGSRYNHETLSIVYKSKNIAEVLDLTIEEALLFFKNHPKINRTLETLKDVGLSYLKLGQPANTLSGGEAQRLKLAKELAKKTLGHTLYIFDEPTTGLHFDDISHLFQAINRLVEKENTVIIIEHNLDIVKNADYIIDLGPDGGNRGGEVVALGTPNEIALNKNSHTGKYLKKELGL